MSGKYLLDTNALIYAINRRVKLPPAEYAVSVITKMELLSWPRLSPSDEQQLRAALLATQLIQLTSSIQEETIEIRKVTSMKLPDSIISASAIDGDYVLVTDDEKLRNRHPGTSLTLDELLNSM